MRALLRVACPRKPTCSKSTMTCTSQAHQPEQTRTETKQQIFTRGCVTESYLSVPVQKPASRESRVALHPRPVKGMWQKHT